MTGKVESEKHVIRISPSSYCPSKEDLEEDVNVDATLEQVRHALMRSVIVKEKADA